VFCVGEKFRKPSLRQADSSAKFLKLLTSEAWSLRGAARAKNFSFLGLKGLKEGDRKGDEHA